MKKIKKYICYLIILSNVFILSGCSNQNQDELLQAKLQSEMQYFDSSITDMLNKANGLKLQNYQVSAEKIEEQTTGGESSQGSQSTGTQTGEQSSGASGKSQEEQQSSGSQQQSSGGESSSGQSSSQGGGQEEQDNVKYKMVENSVLTGERTPDWEGLTSDVESIYSDWSVVTLDLYKKNVDSQKILGFNTDLDELTKAIKDKDKAKTLTLLSKLYSYIPAYSSEFSDNQMQTNLYKVKSNVFNAYAIIEQNNPEEVSKYLRLAEEEIVAMMNNMGSSNENEYNVNKAYIILKDLQNSVDGGSTDIFYLKYKNLIQELNVL